MWGNSGPPRPQLSCPSSAIIRFAASGCSPKDSHKVAQGHGGGEGDREGRQLLGDPELGFRPFSG